MTNRRMIVEKIKLLTQEIKDLEDDAQYLTEDDYIEACWTYNQIKKCKEEIKELNKSIKEY